MRRVRIDGQDVDAVEVMDRGLRFGDGVFETLLAADGAPVWWQAHFERLRRGCERLGMACPASSQLLEETCAVLDAAGCSVVRIQLSRGGDTRGYASEADARARRIIMVEPAPSLLADRYDDGVRVRWCGFTLAQQPLLAGIKHLNRLEQVMARREWSDPDIAEGLMCDSDGRVVSATAANLFIVRDRQLMTPSLERCGVDGICREWIMQQVRVQVRDLDREQVMAADELFLSSSLRGILPVRQLGGRTLDVGTMTRDLQHRLWREVPALHPRAGTGA